ncbi:glycosyltransferase [bacterium]|nr:glycosyltransferase [bacterium]
MKEKLISVIIPCYNVEKYVVQCLDSVINQTYKNLEIICVNDGSTDGTLSILKEYAKKDKRIKIINQKNGGLSAARNAGIDIASSEYIIFVDSDDWLELNACEMAISKMTDDVDLVCWDFNVVNEYNLSDAAYHRQFFDNFKIKDGKYDMDLSYFKDFFYRIAAWNKMYRKSILDKYNLRFPVGQLSEDIPFNFEYFFYTHKFYSITEKLYNYRKSKTSIVYKLNHKRSAKDELCEIVNLYKIHQLFVDNGCWEQLKPFFVDVIFINFCVELLSNVKPLKNVCDLLKKVVVDCNLASYPDNVIVSLMNNKYKQAKKYCSFSFNHHLVSIIVPVYNKELYLNRCLDSLRMQTYEHIEIVCVDDGSTDNSLFILEEYAKIDGRIKIFKNEKNMGIGYTRQKGLDNSSAEYIMWCDADDSFEKNCVEKMLKTMLKYDVDIIECLPNYHDNPLVTSRKYLPFGSELCKNGKSDIDLFVYRWSFKSVWGHIFKRSIIKENDIRFPNTNMSEDLVFVWLYLLKAKSIYFLSQKLYNYYVVLNGAVDNYCSENYIQSYGEFLTFKYVMDFVRDHNWKDKFYICNEMSYALLSSYYRDISVVSNYIGEFMDTASLCPVLPFASKYFPQEINIFFSSDDNYVEALSVAITSILQNSIKEDLFNFYILDMGISNKNKKKIQELVKIKQFNIEFLKVDEKLFSGFFINNSRGYITKATYARYLIPTLKPELKKCLYLDCDILVRKSLRELYNTDLGDNYVAAVRDGCFDSTSAVEELNEYIPSDSYSGIIAFKKKYNIDRYFNAGVLLINNEKWKKENITDKLFKATKELHDDLVLNDQDVMNYLFKGKVKFLDIGYNVQECFYFLNINKKLSSVKDEYYKSDPVICHFSNDAKPWNGISSHPFRAEWYHYLKFTPFKKNGKKHLKKIMKIILEL